MDNNAIPFLSKLPLTNKAFVDVGANDGVTGSMTFSLEQDGWRGILVEPNPILVELLKSKRQSTIVNCAVSSAENALEFNFVSGPDNLHGLSRFNYSEEFAELVKKNQGTIEKKMVECQKLENILFKNNVQTDFSFLKVDVEGHELEVFKSLNLEKFKPILIVAEDNTKDLDKRVRQYLKQFNYNVVARIGTNNFFVKDENTNRFLLSFISAQITFLRWDLKRIIWKAFGKEFVSQNI